MENTNTFKVQSTSSNLISLNVTPGHYATSSSHINYYIDMTSLKSRRSEAHAAAKVLAARYAATTIIDTIVCLDGTNVIGAYLADELLNTGILSANRTILHTSFPRSSTLADSLYFVRIIFP